MICQDLQLPCSVFLIVCLALGCGTEKVTEEPIVNWLGAWQYMRYEDKQLVSRDNRKVHFFQKHSTPKPLKIVTMGFLLSLTADFTSKMPRELIIKAIGFSK